MDFNQICLIILAIIGGKSILTWFYNKLCDAIEYNNKLEEINAEEASTTSETTTFTSLDGEDTSEEIAIVNDNIATEASSDSDKVDESGTPEKETLAVFDNEEKEDDKTPYSSEISEKVVSNKKPTQSPIKQMNPTKDKSVNVNNEVFKFTLPNSLPKPVETREYILTYINKHKVSLYDKRFKKDIVLETSGTDLTTIPVKDLIKYIEKYKRTSVLDSLFYSGYPLLGLF